ncbi:MAG TPA: hypothetical protein VN721_13250, partial [Flavipsychrobacter sp.]|nr:hypothetical protein [Flavipsychrobacter sp.]
AWVSWRYGRGNCGWAPLGPNVSVGVAIGGGWHCPDNWWVFVGPQYLYRPNPYSYWRGPSYNNTYIRQTTIINNTYIDNSTHVTYSYGPRANQIEAVTHQRVQVYKVAAVNRPGSTNINRNEVNIYRPAVNRSTISSAHPANVVRAPRPISRQLQGPTGRTPAFHQVMERQNPAMVKAASTALRNPRSPQVQPEVLKSQVITSRPQPAAQRPAPNANRPQPVNNARPNQQNISRPSPANRPQPQSQSQHMQQSRPQPQPQHMQQSRPQPQPQHIQQSRPQPQPQHMQQPRPQSQPQHMQQPRPQPQNFNRPQSQPQHMQQPRPQPQNFNRPQSQPQHIQQPRPMPQQAPHMQAPPRPEGHPGGGGGHPEGGGRPNGRG